ncbi:MAG: NADH-quinone oxidoreductase subunit L [Anaerolineae bacterium]|nr:NADH-quinone oxidoreductase subunit L [Anaerolineae bacterium]
MATILANEANWAATLAPWVIFSPLIGLLLNLLFGLRWGERVTGFVASLASVASFALAVALGIAIRGQHEALIVPLADWISVGSFDVQWALRVDSLSVMMMLVVAGVGAIIHVYATGYMHSDVRHNGDPGRYRRFFVYFNLFILAMLVLVSADNYLMLFVGWEGVGLCSYLLIGFWFEGGAGGIANAKAAKKAFVVNRIGDFGLLLAIFIMFWSFGTLQFDAVFAQAGQVFPGIILAITLFMLLGVSGKSAQLPLYVWLPDAMAGPTPVSALIHAATMVTAGVYLIARSSALFLAAPAAQAAVMWVGALTALLAATIAVGQFDIKKVLAYSTISQLGFMVAAVGMGAFSAGMFHLTTHAFFKALLFLAAGSVILGMERGHEDAGDHELATAGGGHEDAHAFDPQDMRNMGGLQRRMPWTMGVYLVGALALSGIAPLAGFFSKDEILGAAREVSLPVFIILVISAFLTAFYMGRQIFMVFFGKPRSAAADHSSESKPIIVAPLVILAILSVLGGVLNLPGVYWLEHWLEPVLAGNLAVEFELPVALLSLAVALTGLLLAWGVYGKRSLGSPENPDPLAKPMGGLFTAAQHKWWVDELYQAVFVHPFERISLWLAGTFDQGGIDGVANGLGALTRTLSNWWSKFQNGFVRSYALAVVFGMVAILAFLVLR